MTSKIRRAIVAAGLSLGLAVAAIPASADTPTANVDATAEAEAGAITTQALTASSWGSVWHARSELRWPKEAAYEFAPGNFSVTDTEGDKLVYQTDGNLVLYVDKRARWQSGTAGVPGGKLSLQKDGNVVIYQMPGSRPRWQSGAYPERETLFTALLQGYAVHVNRGTVTPGCWGAARATVDANSRIRGGWQQHWNSGWYCP